MPEDPRSTHDQRCASGNEFQKRPFARHAGRSPSATAFPEQIDTTTSGGKLIFHVFAALAEFERDVIRERTQAGLTAARARGRRGGHLRTAALNDARTVALAQRLYDDKNISIDDICKTLRVSRSTLYRYVQVKRKPSARDVAG